jgi:hypothetical protein
VDYICLDSKVSILNVRITKNKNIYLIRIIQKSKLSQREHLKGKKTHVLREMSNEALMRLKEGLQNLYLH